MNLKCQKKWQNAIMNNLDENEKCRGIEKKKKRVDLQRQQEKERYMAEGE